VFSDNGREREMGDDNGNDMEDRRRYEMSGVRLAQLGFEDLVLVFLHPGS
jgi:hypothetical protein